MRVEDIVRQAEEDRTAAEAEHLAEKAQLNGTKLKLKTDLRTQEQQYEVRGDHERNDGVDVGIRG